MHDPTKHSSDEVLAAGAVVWRGSGDGRQLCVIHRPRYDDWTLPKGKLSSREQLPACAVREVREEALVSIALGHPLDVLRYRLANGNEKVVHWWNATVIGPADPGAIGDEVDDIAWLGVEAALERLTHENEHAVVRQAVSESQPTVPLIIMRHGKAHERATWKGRDLDRPLARRGERQAVAAIDLLRAYGVGRVLSSPAVRCTHTVAPYAAVLGLTITHCPDLAERGDVLAERIEATMHTMAEQTLTDGVPTVVCGHRPLLATMLSSLGVPARTFATADALIAHLGRDANGEVEVVALEEHPSLS